MYHLHLHCHKVHMLMCHLHPHWSVLLLRMVICSQLQPTVYHLQLHYQLWREVLHHKGVSTNSTRYHQSHHSHLVGHVRRYPRDSPHSSTSQHHSLTICREKHSHRCPAIRLLTWHQVTRLPMPKLSPHSPTMLLTNLLILATLVINPSLPPKLT